MRDAIKYKVLFKFYGAVGFRENRIGSYNNIIMFVFQGFQDLKSLEIEIWIYLRWKLRIHTGAGQETNPYVKCCETIICTEVTSKQP